MLFCESSQRRTAEILVCEMLSAQFATCGTAGKEMDNEAHAIAAGRCEFKLCIIFGRNRIWHGYFGKRGKSSWPCWSQNRWYLVQIVFWWKFGRGNFLSFFHFRFQLFESVPHFLEALFQVLFLERFNIGKTLKRERCNPSKILEIKFSIIIIIFTEEIDSSRHLRPSGFDSLWTFILKN